MSEIAIGKILAAEVGKPEIVGYNTMNEEYRGETNCLTWRQALVLTIANLVVTTIMVILIRHYT